jgi:hypothetical protein
MSGTDYPRFEGFNEDGTFSLDEWREFWQSLTPTQQERIKDKARWEQCTLSHVTKEWPSLLKDVV